MLFKRLLAKCLSTSPLSFDIYATLIDWETGIYNSLIQLLLKLPSDHPHHPLQNSAAQTRKFLLTSYTNFEHSVQMENPTLPYPKVLATVWKRLAGQLDIEHSGMPDNGTDIEKESEEFGRTIGTGPAFEDTVEGIKISAKYYSRVCGLRGGRISRLWVRNSRMLKMRCSLVPSSTRWLTLLRRLREQISEERM